MLIFSVIFQNSSPMNLNVETSDQAFQKVCKMLHSNYDPSDELPQYAWILGTPDGQDDTGVTKEVEYSRFVRIYEKPRSFDVF